MNALEAALLDVAKFLDLAGADYMVIGGFANLHWGTPRLTEDLDVTVRIGEEAQNDFISRLVGRFRALVPDPIAFAHSHGEDVEGIVLRQASSLDRSYLDPLVEQLAHALERPGISTFYKSCLRKAGASPT